jgi:hypothetical protein
MIDAISERNIHWNYGVRAADHLNELEIIMDRVNAMELPEAELARFHGYAEATQDLLRTIQVETRQAGLGLQGSPLWAREY